MNFRFRHSRAGGRPVICASVNCMPLDSRLRGNDEIYDDLVIRLLNRSKIWTKSEIRNETLTTVF